MTHGLFQRRSFPSDVFNQNAPWLTIVKDLTVGVYNYHEPPKFPDALTPKTKVNNTYVKVDKVYLVRKKSRVRLRMGTLSGKITSHFQYFPAFSMDINSGRKDG